MRFPRAALTLLVLTAASCSGTLLTDVETSPESDPLECSTLECILGHSGEYRDKLAISRAIAAVEAAGTPGTNQSWSCHDALHKLGRLVDISPEDVPSEAMSACSGGFVHGLFTRYAKSDSGYLSMVQVCTGLSGLDRVLCKHGYGHAAAATGTVAQAIETCQKLVLRDTETSDDVSAEDVPLDELCSDGAFMELAARSSEGDGAVLPERVDEFCLSLTGVWGWGCFRQLLPRADDAAVIKVADMCDQLDVQIGEGCAVGVAESVIERYRRTGVLQTWCDSLGRLSQVCSERVVGVLGR